MSAYIDIEALKVRPKLKPSDFATREEALDYAEARLDSLQQRILQLKGEIAQEAA